MSIWYIKIIYNIFEMLWSYIPFKSMLQMKLWKKISQQIPVKLDVYWQVSKIKLMKLFLICEIMHPEQRIISFIAVVMLIYEL